VSEFDEKLNALLSNPDSMAQIMQLAQSLSGESGNIPDAPSAPPPPPPPPQTPPSGGNPLSALSSLDPKLLMRLLPVIQELGNGSDNSARQLLYALRPYLKPERQEKIERALQLARLFHLGKKFLSEWEG